MENYLNIQRMAKGPSNPALIRPRMTPMETISNDALKLPAGQLQSYFKLAMKWYEASQQKMAHQSADRSTVCATTSEANFPDVEMKSVMESYHSRYHHYDPYDLEYEELR